MRVLKTRRKSVDGTSDLSERKFKFFGGEIRTKTLNKKMMQKSQPTKEKEEERERHTRARY